MPASYDGTVYCWGDNLSGQIGIPSTTTCKAVGALIANEPCVDTPRLVTQLLQLGSQIVAGFAHTCALNAGIAECWGSNTFGELGDGTAGNQRTLPQNVLNSPVFTVLTAGPNATCGLSQTGVYCWGVVPFASQATTSVATPHIMDGMHNPGFFSSLVVGQQFACFVAVGSLQNENDCQGIDNDGQLGIPSNTSLFQMPTTCNPQLVSGGNSLMPPCLPNQKPIPFTDFLFPSSLSPVLRASAGLDYVCADVSNGNVQCVGNNLSGRLGSGLGGATNPNAAAVVNASGSSLQLHGVTTGLAHACALDANGYAWCWGRNQFGELGFGITGAGTFNFAQPVAGARKFRMLAAGGQHTCGIGTDNYVYCWGDNEFGQLGVGKNGLTGGTGFGVPTSTGTPTQVPAF